MKHRITGFLDPSVVQPVARRYTDYAPGPQEGGDTYSLGYLGKGKSQSLDVKGKMSFGKPLK
jgi:hypothetical protein